MKTEDTQANILIVDDTPANLQVLSKLLAQEGYKVRAAADGLHAVAAVQANPPDLILLDIMMPGLDGYQTCLQLKADSQTRNIPIIFISALNEAMDKVKAFAVGGLDYVIKPFQPEEVLARVATHLTLRRLQIRLERQNRELAERNTALQEALATIKTLSGVIPICAWCGRNIQDKDEWVDVQTYIETHSDTEFTHGICPSCFQKAKEELNPR